MIMRKNIQMNCMFQLLLTLLLIAGCSSSDDGPEVLILLIELFYGKIKILA